MPIIGGGSGGGSSGGTQGTEIGYDQLTGNVSIASTTEATGTTLIACAAHTFDGAPVIAQVSGFLTDSSLATIMTLCLFEGATEIGRMFLRAVAAASSSNVTNVNGWLRFAPTAASHTYTLTGFTNNAGGTQAVFAGAAGGTGAVVPAFVRFTKV